MKFKLVLILLLISSWARASHTNDSAFYITDIKTAAGTSIFKFPTAAPTASRVCTFNSDGEATSSSITTTTLAFLDATSSIQTQLNGKEPTQTKGSISTSTTGVSIGSGSSSTVGPNVTVNVQTASTSQPGLISSTDWNTFNNKQASGNYITALTSDVTASGAGSVAATVAAVGGSSASNVHAAELLANAATSSSTGSTIVKRDSSGDFNTHSIVFGTNGKSSFSLSGGFQDFITVDTFTGTSHLQQDDFGTMLIVAESGVDIGQGSFPPSFVANNSGAIYVADAIGNKSVDAAQRHLVAPGGSIVMDYSSDIPNFNNGLAIGSTNLTGPPEGHFTYDTGKLVSVSFSNSVQKILTTNSNTASSLFTVSSNLFTCSVNPAVELRLCDDSTCATGTAMSTATVTATGLTTGSGPGSYIPGGSYVGFVFTAGVCTALQLSADSVYIMQ